MRCSVRAFLNPAISESGYLDRGEAGEENSQVQVVMFVGTVEVGWGGWEGWRNLRSMSGWELLNGILG